VNGITVSEQVADEREVFLAARQAASNIVRRRRGPPGDFADAVGVAAEAAVIASRRYDPALANGCTRLTYMRVWAYRRLLDERRKLGPITRSQYRGGVRMDTVPLAQLPPMPLDRPLQGGDGTTTLAGTVADPQADADRAHAEDSILTESILARLGVQDRTVLVESFYDGLDLQEIGDRLGVTESRVCQIRKRALTRARAIAEGVSVKTSLARAAAATARAVTRRAETALTKGWRDGKHPTGHGDFDLALTDHYAPKVRQALGRLFTAADVRGAVVTARQVAPLTKAASDPMRRLISSVAEGHLHALHPDGSILRQVIEQVMADGWVAGAHVAVHQTAGAAGGAVGEIATGIDWSAWAPGDGLAALKVADGGLADLLSQAGITVKGLTDTTIRQIGDMIGAGLQAGDNVDTIAGSMWGLLGGDTYRSLMIAQTEVARAMTAATADVYAQNGVRRWDWMTTSGACTACLDRESRNPHDLASEKPPGHPMCRCAMAPASADIGGPLGQPMGDLPPLDFGPADTGTFTIVGGP